MRSLWDRHTAFLFYFSCLQNGHSETKEAVTDTKKTNGHDKDEAYHSDSNGTSEPAPNAAEADIKGKQRWKIKTLWDLKFIYSEKTTT